MTSVVAETIDLITRKCPPPFLKGSIEDLVIGIFFTGVKLSSGHAGVAGTPIGEIPEAVCCPTSAARMPQAGDLEGRSISEILNYALDANVLKRAIGVATLNAVSQWFLESGGQMGSQIARDVDGLDVVGIRPQETVSLIGAFVPYIRRLKLMGNPFFIIEKNPQTLRLDEMKYFKPESEMRAAIDQSDVVISTGTTIVNHTIDTILSATGRGKRMALIGPTASMIPDAFFKMGVKVMAGVRILDPDLMIKILKQGGSAYHLLKGCSEKIAYIRT